jgi:hypothetical protein
VRIDLKKIPLIHEENTAGGLTMKEKKYDG